jgi:hypothetical protein
MATNDLKLVTEQEDALAAALRAENPLFDLYLKVRETRQQLEGKQPKSAPGKRIPDAAPPPRTANSGISNRLAALKIAEAHLRATKKRATSGELCKIVQQKGIVIPGKKPNKRMAAYLSNDERFNNAHDGRGEGYGLAEWA